MLVDKLGRFLSLFAATDRGANLLSAFVCLAAVVVNQAIFRLGAMPFAWTIVLALTIMLAAILTPHVELRRTEVIVGRPRVENVVIGVVLLTPVALSFALGWNREFPFSGDHYFHVGQSYRIALWWLSPLGSTAVKLPTIEDVRQVLSRPSELLWSRVVILFIVTTVIIQCYRRNRHIALLLVAIILIGWGMHEETIFLRYPGGGYFLRIPFLGPAFLLNNLELSGRLTNIFALVAWLFILRPWLLGRWPDARILPAAALLFWQKEVIYYFDSVYLEPWAFIFALLAVETLIERGREGAPAACLLVGLAAAVKEPLILALPFVWFAGAPWQGPWRRIVSLSATAFAAGVPFLIYYAARKSLAFEDMGPDRLYRFDLAYDRLLSYLSEFGHQMGIAFSGPSAILAVAALAVVPFLLWRQTSKRIALACVVAAGIGVVVVFAFDANSTRWAGYFRFFLYSMPFLTAGFIALGQTLKPRTALALGIAVLTLQAPSTFMAVARSAGLSTDRNFVEHYDAPIVFPMKSIIAEAESKGILRHNIPILANLADAMMRPLPGSPVTYGASFGELFCECSAAHPAILALFIRFANMNAARATLSSAPGERRGIWQSNREQRAACVATMRQTCVHILERNEHGELVAALGIHRKD